MVFPLPVLSCRFRQDLYCQMNVNTSIDEVAVQSDVKSMCCRNETCVSSHLSYLHVHLEEADQRGVHFRLGKRAEVVGGLS